MDLPVLHQLGIAVGLGLLVGLQRERSASRIAGIRTFPLITSLGVLCGVAAQSFGGWVVAAGLLGLAALAVVANAVQIRSTELDPGMTTEVAGLVMFMIGVALTAGLVLEAIVAGAGVALLLHWKAKLHSFAGRIEPEEFDSLMRFILITLVILPVLPNHGYGPYGILNPFRIWLMVVLIVGISLAGYVAFRLFGAKLGTLAAGILGGLISSTATTISYSRRTREHPGRSPAAALIVALASTVVFARVLVEIAVVAPSILGATAGPIVAMMGVMILVCGALYLSGIGSQELELKDEEPPSDLRAAVMFGLLYAAVLLGVAFAKQHWGDQGLYAVAAISGLTDMDAITLSTSELMRADELPPNTGWRLILVGALANLVFKGGIIAALGHPRLRRRIGIAFSTALVAGVGILFLWPG
ncbi:MAG: MgtC/SapB family protein [Gemmatimonadetes bacterium]|nr:MgtC/SapB family protein [Gemmatimonadota bacterium]